MEEAFMFYSRLFCSGSISQTTAIGEHSHPYDLPNILVICSEANYPRENLHHCIATYWKVVE